MLRNGTHYANPLSFSPLTDSHGYDAIFNSAQIANSISLFLSRFLPPVPFQNRVTELGFLEKIGSLFGWKTVIDSTKRHVKLPRFLGCEAIDAWNN